MVERFLKYSLERQKKICVVLLTEGGMKKQNLLVTEIAPDGSFSALLPGRKRTVRFEPADVLTATYARGDHGELEE